MVTIPPQIVVPIVVVTAPPPPENMAPFQIFVPLVVKVAHIHWLLVVTTPPHSENLAPPQMVILLVLHLVIFLHAPVPAHAQEKKLFVSASL